MAVSSSTPRITQQKIDTVGVGEHGAIHAKQVFDVVAYSAVDAAQTLASERGISYGTAYRNQIGQVPDLQLAVDTITPKSKTPPTIGAEALYEIAVVYKKSSGGGRNDRPDFGEVTYRWGHSIERREVTRDRDGKPLSVADNKGLGKGKTYRDISLSVPHRSLTAHWWRKTDDLRALFKFDASINSADFIIHQRYLVEKGYAMCLGIDPIQEDATTGKTLLAGQFKFAVDGEPFDPIKFPAFVEEDGVRRLLDNNGQYTDDPDTAHLESFDVTPPARLKDFSVLGI